MLKNIYLYLFIFAAIIALVIYVNSRGYQETLEMKVENLQAKTDRLEAALAETDDDDAYEQIPNSESQMENMPFKLEGNEVITNYFLAQDLNIAEVRAKVRDALLELGVGEQENPLIPYNSEKRMGFIINDTHFLNHKWLIANFTDGDVWGDILIQYSIEEDGSVSFDEIRTLLYDRYR